MRSGAGGEEPEDLLEKLDTRSKHAACVDGLSFKGRTRKVVLAEGYKSRVRISLRASELLNC